MKSFFLFAVFFILLGGKAFAAEESGDYIGEILDEKNKKQIENADIKEQIPQEKPQPKISAPIQTASLSVSQSNLVESEIKRLLEEFGERDIVVPEKFTNRVKYFISRYQTKERSFYERALKRSANFLPMISEIFRERKVPEDMAYIALVESGFNTKAESPAGARGMWQFIRSTGVRYGLTINRNIDERLDPVKATVAARDYFVDLIAIFGSRSFMIAMAAYNAGEYGIQNALKKLRDPFEERTFWHLSEQGLLRDETDNYVPRIIAAAIIAKNPEAFGFQKPLPTQVVMLNEPAKAEVEEAEENGNTAQEVPDISKGGEKPSDDIFSLPGAEILEKSKLKAQKSAKSPEKIEKVSASPKSKIKTKTMVYVAKKGDSINEISEWFDTPMSRLKVWNPYLKKRSLRQGDRVVIKDVPKDFGKVVYTVKRGENLTGIAAKFNTDPEYILRWNLLRSSKLKVSQKLVIYGGVEKAAKRAVASKKPIEYKIARGNTLFAISNIFSVDIEKIMEWNNLKRGDIKAGEVLKIYPSRKIIPATYRVRNGDTLARIAKRLKTTELMLITVNGISKNEPLRAGETLKYYKKA